MFSYVAMDDGLSGFGAAFITGLEKAANPNAYYLAFGDFQGPDNSYLFYIKNAQQINKSPLPMGEELKMISSPRSFLAPDIKEVNSNDPNVLSQTINWAFSQYQGKFKVFDILAHGGGYMGIGTDDNQTGQNTRQIMTVYEFSNGLRQGLKGRKLDVMNMLSCLMGNVEAIYELRGIADVVIASEDSVRATQNTGIDFTAELARIIAQPNPDAKTIGKQMAIFGDAKNSKSGYSTIAAVDMTRIEYLKSSVNRLSNAILAAFPKFKTNILTAYNNVPELINSSLTGQRDLWNFCVQLQKINHAPLQQAALEVKQELKMTIIHARDREGANANGLSIFMPTLNADMNLPPDFNMENSLDRIGYLKTKFAKDTAWDKVIDAIWSK